MTDKELADPIMDQMDERTLQKANAYMCEDHGDRKPGACSMSPFQVITHAQKLTPLDNRRLF